MGKCGALQSRNPCSYLISDQSSMWFSLTYLDLCQNSLLYFRPYLSQELFVWLLRRASIEFPMLIKPQLSRDFFFPKHHTQSQTRAHNPYPSSNQNGLKTIPITPSIPILKLIKGVLPPPRLIDPGSTAAGERWQTAVHRRQIGLMLGMSFFSIANFDWSFIFICPL